METHECLGRNSSQKLRLSAVQGFPGKDNKTEIFPISNEIVAAYLIIVGIVIANSLVIVVLIKRRRKLRSFQVCAMALAISDILFALTIHPMSISTALGSDPKKMFDDNGCLYFGILALFFGTYDMIIHALISVIRYVNLCRSQKAIEWVGTRNVRYFLLGAVVYSLSWSVGPAFHWGRYRTFELGCTIAFEDDTASGRSFVSCAFIFVFFLPLEAGKQKKFLNKTGSISTGSKKYTIGGRSFRTYAVQIKLVKLSAIIAACYVIAWLPYATISLLETFGHFKGHSSQPDTIRTIASLFCKSAAFYNPILYLFLSKDFRLETKTVLGQLRDSLRFKRTAGGKRPHPSVISRTSSSNRTLSTRSFSKRQSSVRFSRHKKEITSDKSPPQQRANCHPFNSNVPNLTRISVRPGTTVTEKREIE